MTNCATARPVPRAKRWPMVCSALTHQAPVSSAYRAAHRDHRALVGRAQLWCGRGGCTAECGHPGCTPAPIAAARQSGRPGGLFLAAPARWPAAPAGPCLGASSSRWATGLTCWAKAWASGPRPCRGGASSMVQATRTCSVRRASWRWGRSTASMKPGWRRRYPAHRPPTAALARQWLRPRPGHQQAQHQQHPRPQAARPGDHPYPLGFCLHDGIVSFLFPRRG